MVRTTPLEAKRRSAQRKVWVLSGLAGLAALSYVLFAQFAEAPGGDAEAVCVLLIDATHSTRSIDQSGFRTLPEQTVDGCDERNAVLAVGVIDGHRDGARLLAPELELYEPQTFNRHQREQAAEEVHRKALEAVDTALSLEAGILGTDLVGALRDASTWIDELGSHKPAHLVIATDGIQFADSLDLSELTYDADPTALVPAPELLPDLKGVAVDMVGVSSGVDQFGNPIPEWFETHIEEFWRDLIAKAGGHLCLYATDAVSLPSECGKESNQ